MLFFFFVQFVSAVEISSEWFVAIHIQSLGSYFFDDFRRIESLYKYGSFRIWQMSNLITIDIRKLLRFVQDAEVRLNMLIQLEMLLHLLERIKIFILWFLLMFVSPLGLLLHAFFYIIQMKNQEL